MPFLVFLLRSCVGFDPRSCFFFSIGFVGLIHLHVFLLWVFEGFGEMPCIS